MAPYLMPGVDKARAVIDSHGFDQTGVTGCISSKNETASIYRSVLPPVVFKSGS